MVLGGAIQVDTGDIMRVLAALAAAFVVYLCLIYFGTRAAYRGGLRNASRDARLRLVPIASIDLGLVVLDLKSYWFDKWLTLPALMHVVAWFLGRVQPVDDAV